MIEHIFDFLGLIALLLIIYYSGKGLHKSQQEQARQRLKNEQVE